MQQQISKRQLRMILRSTGNIFFACFGIFLAWYEFGTKVFSQSLFWVFLAWWAYVSFTAFILDWQDAGKKSTDERIDDLTKEIHLLVNEIRRDRNERKRKTRLEPTHIGRPRRLRITPPTPRISEPTPRLD